MLKKIIFIFCVFCTSIYAQTSALPMVQKINQLVLASLSTHQAELKKNPDIIQGVIRTYFIPHVDTLGMSRSVLGRQTWQHASDHEKDAFTQEFTNLVLRTYAQPLADFQGETVSFLPMRSAKTDKFSQVPTLINRPNGQKISLIYHLVWVEQQWKIYDLSIEGVSLLSSFKNQFSDALKQNSLPTLIQEMHKKNQKHLS